MIIAQTGAQAWGMLLGGDDIFPHFTLRLSTPISNFPFRRLRLLFSFKTSPEAFYMKHKLMWQKRLLCRAHKDERASPQTESQTERR